jgi:hypothetical protein
LVETQIFAKVPEERINDLFDRLERSHGSGNLDEFIQTFSALSKTGGKNENKKLHLLVSSYLKKEWIEKFDQTSVYLTLFGLRLISDRGKTCANDILSNLSAHLATVPISSTSQLLQSVSCLSRIGLNVDFLMLAHHKQIFAQIMVDYEKNDHFTYLPNLGKIVGLRWSHIPNDIQGKILDKLPKFNDVGFNGAGDILLALKELDFPIGGQTAETLNKINELAVETIVEYCKKNGRRLSRYSPPIIVRQLIEMGFEKHTLSPTVIKEFRLFMESDIYKNIADALLT